MTDREAMEKALYALEHSNTTAPFDVEGVVYWEGVKIHEAAIAALRERLAQPAPTIVGCVPAGDTSQERVAETEKQRHEQKLVAWIYRGSKVKEKT